MESINRCGLGRMGEEIAADYLGRNNYSILDRNYRAGKLGELDIIARESGYICFIEVKTRRNTLFGMPSEAVGFKKRNNIRRLAYVYLKSHNLMDCDVRFDVVEVLIQASGNSINIIKNAF
ncbi:putative endonuclease [Anaerobacterium chartisolvens]|uniref:UPF0102 protein DFR58_102115 n=1 Tax=Anaerobacterium chartisolvens TaxID=1297424 RepID=A0A369BHL0_9FIRM|nr:YraN family protein [Anaerobacterium chartisolvens]RCX20046.1 putative endonuclease [Anaerobacterium chartisolvens]